MISDVMHEVLLVILINANGSWYVSELVTDDLDDCEEVAAHMRDNIVSSTTLYICATTQKKISRRDKL